MSSPELQARDTMTVRTSNIMSAEKLLGRAIEEPKNISKKEEPTNIGKEPLMVIQEKGSNGIPVYTAAIRVRISGHKQNQIYWEIAPALGFGLDHGDIVSDHTRLLTHTSEKDHVKRLHEELKKPWKIWAHYGNAQLNAIKSSNEKDSYLLPIIRWTLQHDADGNSQRKFIYSPLMHSEKGKTRLRKFLGTNIPQNRSLEDVCDPALGLYILAMFSPDQRKWPATAALPSTEKMIIGSTQAPLFTLMKEKDLLQSPLLPAAEAAVKK